MNKKVALIADLMAPNHFCRSQGPIAVVGLLKRQRQLRPEPLEVFRFMALLVPANQVANEFSLPFSLGPVAADIGADLFAERAAQTHRRGGFPGHHMIPSPYCVSSSYAVLKTSAIRPTITGTEATKATRRQLLQ